jgi:alpha-L-fucosidase
MTTMVMAQAQKTLAVESPALHDARMQWWREARFGMFIHWGLYAIPAGTWNGKSGYGEWIRNNAEIPLAVYDTLVPHFNPVRFNADAWARMAKQAGMRYMILTSKHHDGFALFDSKLSDFDVMSTPFRRDIVRELAEACRRQGIVFGVYHSIMDWHHPDYLPRRRWESDRPDSTADFERYVNYMKGQLRELLTNYGPLGVLWFDGEWESTWNESRGRDLYQFVRTLQPSIIINNRVGAAREGMTGTTAPGGFGGDFGTPEQEVPATGLPGVDWESCMTMNDHWGYSAIDTNYKSSAELVRTLVDIASKGGNYLLNVGPTALGEFPRQSIERLRDIGMWMEVNGNSIVGTSAGPFEALPWGRATQRDDGPRTTLYLHMFDWPKDGRLIVPGLLTRPAIATVLGDVRKRRLKVSQERTSLVVHLPKMPPSTMPRVLQLSFKGKPDVNHPPRIAAEAAIFVDTISVSITSDRRNVQIRYSTNGRPPTNRSPLVTGPVPLTGSCTIIARCFRGDRPVSEPTSATFSKVAPRSSVALPSVEPGWRYSYYEGTWDALPSFGALVPKKAGVVDDITFAPRDEQERFGFVYEGFVNVPNAGVYTLAASSDDGSRLWVGDTSVVNNDGLHAAIERRGVIALGAGWHPMRVEFFEKTGGDALTVSIQGPGVPKQPIPKAWVVHSTEEQ